VEQRYVLANPFAGIKVRGSQRAMAVETTHAFTEGEWLLVRTIANGLEWSYGWQAAAAQQLRFLLDFGYATGLRISELANAALRHLDADALGDHWLHLVGKGGKPARVALTPLARAALERHLLERELPVSRARWNPTAPLIGSLDGGETGITPLRLWEAPILQARSGHHRRRSSSVGRSSAGRHHTGCGTPTRPTRWPRVSN
jgi:integrase